MRFIRDGVQLGVANSALGIGRRQEVYTPLWDDFKWIREAWPGPLVIKGVVRPDDARRAVDHGAGAVVVSNHGGLALDGELGTMRALPDVVAAIGGSAEILLDGGVRDGGDVLKALGVGGSRCPLWTAVCHGSCYRWRAHRATPSGTDENRHQPDAGSGWGTFSLRDESVIRGRASCA